MQSNILVTGATGNVGLEVVKALTAVGQSVRAADVDTQRIHDRLDGKVEAVRFIFGDPATYQNAFVGIEKMFLLRPPQISDVKKTMFPAIDAAAAAGVKKFVFLSLIGIEKNKVVPHFKVEQRLREMRVEYTFLRCSFFMQNLNTTHRTEIRDRSEIYIPAGKARTSFLDVRDIGAVAALALLEDRHAFQAYDLTGPQALDYYQVADLFSEILGRKITYRNPTTVAYVSRQVSAGVKLPFALVTAWLYTNTRSGMAEGVTGEVARLLGRSPIPLSQYIQDYKQNWMPD